MKRLWILIFLVIVAGISSALLALMYYSSEELIRKNERIVEMCAAFEALSMGCPKDKKEIESKFNEWIETISSLGKTIYMKKGDGAYAFKISGAGFWDKIEAMISLEPDLATIRNVAIMNEKETPGLGGRIKEPEILERYKGLKLEPEVNVTITKPTRQNEVEAITGATQTSKAFAKIINKSAQEYILAIREMKKL